MINLFIQNWYYYHGEMKINRLVGRNYCYLWLRVLWYQKRSRKLFKTREVFSDGIMTFILIRKNQIRETSRI